MAWASYWKSTVAAFVAASTILGFGKDRAEFLWKKLN
jgi:hypothetical protein